MPRDLDLHLVLDNYATHKTPEIRKWLLRHPRFHLDQDRRRDLQTLAIYCGLITDSEH